VVCLRGYQSEKGDSVAHAGNREGKKILWDIAEGVKNPMGEAGGGGWNWGGRSAGGGEGRFGTNGSRKPGAFCDIGSDSFGNGDVKRTMWNVAGFQAAGDGKGT